LPARLKEGGNGEVIALLLVAVLLLLLFGGLGVAISPLFFVLLALVLVLSLGGWGYYGRRY